MTNTKRTPATVTELFNQPESATLLSQLLEQSETIFVKKLSRNDRDWARSTKKHQNGVYILSKERDAGFFPALESKARKEGAAPIYEVFFEIEWPAIGITKKARLVHYTSKISETHLTGLPKAAFCDAPPASLLVIGKQGNRYKALVVDSQADEYDTVHDTLSLSPDFCSEVFSMGKVRREHEKLTESLQSFMADAVSSFLNGSFPEFSSRYREMPTTFELAKQARNLYLNEHGLKNFDPYAMSKPGDALRTISRGVEYEIFKDYQLKSRSLVLIRILLGDDPAQTSVEKTLRAIIANFPKIDALLLSASQQRKARAGLSFEHHIEAMLLDGGIPFEKQVVLKAKQRPDFILPTKAIYEQPSRNHSEALVLSAKTTLRERWKQVKGEINNCDLYLATVDERIAQNAIEDMAKQGIKLVVPESLKTSNTTEYDTQKSVLSFKEFFSRDIAARKQLWVAGGICLQKTV